MSRRQVNGVNLFCNLFAQLNADAPAPAFREPNSHDFHLWRDVAEQRIGYRMKSESGGDDIHNRRSGLKFDAREIAVANDVAVRLMAANAASSRRLAGASRYFRWPSIPEWPSGARA